MQRQESSPHERLQEERDLYKSLFDTPTGEKVLEKLKQRCYFYKSTFSDMDNLTAHREGQRSVVLHILNIMNDDLYEHFIEQMKK